MLDNYLNYFYAKKEGQPSTPFYEQPSIHKSFDLDNPNIEFELGGLNVKFYANKFDKSFLAFFRILFLEESDLRKENLHSHNFYEKMYSKENEEKVIKYLMTFIKSNLICTNGGRLYLNTLQNNNRLDPGFFSGVDASTITEIQELEKFENSATTKESNDAYLIRYLEKEERDIYKKNMDYLIKKKNSLL